MSTGLVRRVVSLLAVVVLGLAIAPAAAAADGQNAAPSVTATVSNAKPEEPQTVFASATFTDPESATETYTCTIDYGDGTAFVAGTISGMTCTGPAHQYLVTGSYVGMVVVTDSGGASGVWLFGVTYTNDAPYIGGGVAMFGAHDVGHIAYAAAPFWDPGSPQFGPGTETYSCTVDYGDGTGLQTGTYLPVWDYDGFPACIGPDHIYQAAGTYSVTAVVRDSGGATSSATASIAIAPPSSPVVIPPPDQNITSAQLASYGGMYPYSLGSFSDPHGASAGPWNWTVTWQDGYTWSGTTGTQGPLTVGRPLMPGTYRAHLVVQDSAGYTGDAYFNVTVASDIFVQLAPVVVATEGVPTTLDYYFFDPSMAGPWQIHIDWGDGSSNNLSAQVDSGMSAGHVYAAAESDPGHPGGTVYTATVTVTDALGHTGSASRPEPVINLAPVITAQPITLPAGFSGPLTLAEFTDASVGPWMVQIDGGPGFQLEEQIASPGPIQVPYQASFGSHTFTVTVADRGWLYSTATVPVTVANGTPSVSVVLSDYNPREWHLDPAESSAVTVSATFGDPEFGVQSYVCSIDYGDGTVVAGTISGTTCTSSAHQYKVTGNYAVTVTVTDSAGATGVGTSGLSYENWEPSVGGGLVGVFMVGSPVHDVAIVEDPGASFETYTCTVDYGDGSPVQAGTYVPTWPDDGMPRCVGPDHVYSAPGSYSIVTTVTDSGGATGSSVAIETIEPVPAPVVGSISAPGVVNEGSSVSASATFEDASGRTHTCTVDYGDGAGPLAGVVSGFGCQGPTHKMARSGNFTITVKVVAAGGLSGSASTSIAVANVAPVVTSVSAGSVAKLGVAVSATAAFTDPGAGETYKATWTWGDGTTTIVTLSSTARSVTSSHTYSKAGLYVVGISVSDGTASGSAGAAELAIYDPARTVSGNGSIAAPAGACKLSTACSKAATASFSVKASYARNATKPTASLSFSQTSFSLTATSADWFVASTATHSATLQGTAKVNGVTGYKFRLAMADGTVGGRDGLRLQVWNAAGTLVYDGGSVTVLKSGSLAIK